MASSRRASLTEGSCLLLWEMDGPDRLAGTQMSPRESVEWTPCRRSVPPRSGLFLGRSLMNVLARELDRGRPLVVIDSDWLFPTVEAARVDGGYFKVKDMICHGVGKQR